MEIDNKYLKEKATKEQKTREIIEVKLKKNAIHQELKDNALSINGNTFFE